MEEIVHVVLRVDGMCEVKVVSDVPVLERQMLRFVPGAARGLEKVNCYSTSALSLFFGEVTYPAREMAEFRAQGWPRPRRFAVWRLMPEEGYHVSELIEFLADWFFVQTHHRAGYAFMRKLPRTVGNGDQVADCTLLEAEWAPEKCILVGG